MLLPTAGRSCGGHGSPEIKALKLFPNPGKRNSVIKKVKILIIRKTNQNAIIVVTQMG